MSHFSRTKSNNRKIFAGRNPLGRISLGSAPFNMMAVGLVLLAAAFYLVQVNKTAAYGFRMRELEVRINGLKRANEDLEFKAAGIRSMARVDEAGKGLEMVKVDRVDYVQSGTASMAAR